MIDLESIISRAKEAAGVSYNKQFAELLGLSSADFSLRKKRGTLLPIVVEWAINQNVNLDWLIRGVPQKAAVNADVIEHDAVIREHMELVRKFKNKIMARDINLDLVRLESVDESALQELHEIIKIKLKMKGADGSKQTGRVVGHKAANET